MLQVFKSSLSGGWVFVPPPPEKKKKLALVPKNWMANLTQQIHQMVLYDLYELNPPDVPKSVFAFHNIYTKSVEAP